MKSKIWNLINESDSILLLTHENPDGDAIGSAMAFYSWLKKIGKKVDVVIPEIPPVFMFLNSLNLVKEKSEKLYDLAIVVDCSNIERIGQTNNEFEKCGKSVVIDHHVSNTKYGTVNFIDNIAPACTQVIYYLFKDHNVSITKEMGEYLMVGSVTDTNGFSNDNVNKKTFLMVAELIDLGVDVHRIYYNLLLKKSLAQHALTKMTFDRLEFFGNGKIAFSYISHEDMENVGAKKGDHEGLVDIGRNIVGVEISIFMREDNGYNVSFRSNGFDVEKIARKFGGGGHSVASGAKINMSFKEAKEALISEALKELNINERDSSN